MRRTPLRRVEAVPSMYACVFCHSKLLSRAHFFPPLLFFSGDTVLSEPDGSRSFSSPSFLLPRAHLSSFPHPSLRRRHLHFESEQRLPNERSLWTRTFDRDGDLYEVRLLRLSPSPLLPFPPLPFEDFDTSSSQHRALSFWQYQITQEA